MFTQHGAPASRPTNGLAQGGTPGLWSAPSNVGYEADTDAAFVALQNAYRASGGLANGHELAARLNGAGEGGYACLARWIVGRRVFSFSWNEDFWLPMFQFEPAHLTLHEGLRPVMAELADVMDGWAMAQWFVRANEGLQGRSPVSLWASDWPDVFQAARLQRFVMKG